MFKSGFVSIIGEPNVGKSTFLNQVLKQKVAIVSNKPQTTRNVFSGIYNDDNSQIIFIDTPGIHQAKTKLGEYMSSAALSTVKSVDLVMFMINAYDDVLEYNLKIMEKLQGIKTPVFLIINKLDTITDFDRLNEAVEVYKNAYNFEGVFGISALKGDNIDLLLLDIKKFLQEGPKYYPDGEISDRPETFLIQEFIREKILEFTHEEVPHSVMVYLESMKNKKNLTEIMAVVVVERKSQKGIIIGKGGSMLKRIGSAARTDIEALLNSKVYLELFCKVEENWRNREYYLKTYGYKDTE
ncbi:MAG: GTPase Era [Tenericutes bacterium HGW-Tenericutes-5]|jgi:GTP-binding protein Era|nr:MAG: GTPase Era [Tenericutes bacterium HGW-Tenericutes-5]